VDNNCQKDSLEPGLHRKIIIAEPGPYYGISNSSGDYQLKVNAGSFEVKQVFNQFAGLLENQFCPDSNGAYSVLFTDQDGQQSTGKNFANNTLLCPFLKVDVSSNSRRRCARNNTSINVWNVGFAPSSANTTLFWKMPPHVVQLSANVPFTFNPQDSTYSFLLGSMAPNTQRQVLIVDSVKCISGVMGQQQCTKAWVTPHNDCVPDPPGWDGTDLVVSARCINNKPTFTIRNVGAAMSAPRNYSVFVDSLLAISNPIQLGVNDSLVFQVRVTGNPTVRVETNHPFEFMAFAQIRCVISATAVSKIHFAQTMGPTHRRCGLYGNQRQLRPERQTGKSHGNW
jgi:hypothetical protein